MSNRILDQILVYHLGGVYADYTPEKDFEKDFGADSLDALEIAMDIEEKFHIEITDEELSSIKTVGDLEKVISKKNQMDFKSVEEKPKDEKL